MLSNRVQPIEKRMKDIDKEVAAIHQYQDKRTPAQQRNDVFFGALRLLNDFESEAANNLVAHTPNYLTDITGAKRRRNSTLGLYSDT